MHCVLFRIPPGTTREAVIEKLLAGQARADRAAAQRIRIGHRRDAAPSTIRTRACSRTSARWTWPRRTTSAAARHPRGHHRHRRRHRAPRSRRPHAADAQLHRRRRRRVPQRPAWHAGGRPDRRRRPTTASASSAWRRTSGCWPSRPAGSPRRRSSGRCNSFTLAQALADALAARAQIINLSLVGPERSAARSAGRQGHRQAGVIVVGAVSDDPRFGLPGQTTARAAGGRGRDLAGPGRRHPARAGARHRHAGAERALRFRLRQLAGDRAGHRRGRACCWRATRSSASTGCASCWRRSTESHDTTRGPFLSVNACAALAQLVRGASLRAALALWRGTAPAASAG